MEYAPATTRRDTVLHLIPIAVIGVHVVDDAFLHTEAGVTAGDHLASGLVPLAILAAVALCCLRLRPGRRAGVALGLGVVAFASGVAVALHDFTGLLAGLAGLALTTLGATALWRERRRDGRVWLRRALIGVAAAVAALFVLVPVTTAIVATNAPRADVKAADLGAPYENVSVRTLDGLTLRGWYVPSRNRAAIVAFPGRRSPVDEARMLASYGYGVLLLDRRGTGESDGDPNAWGWGGDDDIVAAVAWLKARPDVDPHRIGGLGLSVGGELMIEAAAKTPGLRAVVSEGAGIRSLRDHWGNDDIPAVIRWITPSVAQTAATAVLSDTAPPPGLATLVDDIAPRPLLLIEAEDGAGGEYMTRQYFEAAGEPKQYWRARGGHTGALAAQPAEWQRRVIGFLDRALGVG